MSVVDRLGTSSVSPVPVAFERALAEMGVLDAAPTVSVPLDVAVRVLQEINAAQPRRYVTDPDRAALAAVVRGARYPDRP